MAKTETGADKLRALNACAEAVEWIGERTPARAWADCERGDWLLWICGKMLGKPGWPTRQELVLAACACAETAHKYWVKKYPDDNRPMVAIQTARQWANGKSNITAVKAAADDAYAYAAAWRADAASYAADAAADAASAAAFADAASAADATAAAWRADAAAAAAAYAADAAAAAYAAAWRAAAAAYAASSARKKSRLETAQLVRSMLTPNFKGK